jgi:hypothetical protein
MKQFRLRLELVTRRTRRAFEERRRALRSGETVSRPVPGDVSRRHEAILRARGLYVTFEERYDDLVGLLCVAAQEGVTPGREAKYREQRGWFVSHYERVKPEVSRFLQADESDLAPGLWGHRSCDAFEALFRPGNIAAMLSADGGNLIGRLMRTQAALAAWDETLRRAEEALIFYK